MALDEIEHFFACPSCAARISVLLDPSVTSERRIEDCEVCCRPIDLTYALSDRRVTLFEAIRA